MWNLDELITLAAHHVEDGRRIIAAQPQRIADGRAGPGAYDLLAAFEETQGLFEADLARLMEERSRGGRAEAFLSCAKAILAP